MSDIIQIPTLTEVGMGGAFLLMWYLVRDTINKNTEALNKLNETVAALKGYMEGIK